MDVDVIPSMADELPVVRDEDENNVAEDAEVQDEAMAEEEEACTIFPIQKKKSKKAS